MTERNLKCPDCDFRTGTMKGINIHRRKKHEAPRSGFRGFEVACCPRASIMSRLHAPDPYSHRLRPGCCQLRPSDFRMVHGGRAGDSSSRVLGVSGVHASDMMRQFTRSIISPTCMPHDIHFAALDLRKGVSHVPTPTTTPSRASRDRGSCSPQERLTEDCLSSPTSSDDLQIAECPVEEQPPERPSLDADPPQAFNSFPNKHGTSAESLDDRDDSDSLPPCPTVRDLLKRIRPAGRQTLKDVWPTCFAELASIQCSVPGLLPRKENELKICEMNPANKLGIVLALLGNCPVLDYDPSSVYELVLRCSSCEKPMNGIQNMESHIMKHLESRRHPHDIPCEVSQKATNAPDPDQSHTASDTAFEPAGCAGTCQEEHRNSVSVATVNGK